MGLVTKTLSNGCIEYTNLIKGDGEHLVTDRYLIKPGGERIDLIQDGNILDQNKQEYLTLIK